MPAPNPFPHLHWVHQGPFEVLFNGGRPASPEVTVAQADRKGHAGRIRNQLDALRRRALANAEDRSLMGLPELSGNGFILRVPDSVDVDSLAHALGIELVAETGSGLMFASSEDLDLARLEEVLAKFEVDAYGGGSAGNVLDVFSGGDDTRKLDELLTGNLRQAWPFRNEQIYTLDIGIQTAASTRSFDWTPLQRRRKGVSEEERAARNREIRLNDQIRAGEIWEEAAMERERLLLNFIVPHGGGIVDGLTHTAPTETRRAIIFPDSIEVRVTMSGVGFRDLVENFPYLFQVSLPPDVRFLPGSPEAEGLDGDFKVLAPDADAPKVCVIDSGLQEDHRWLEPAIDGQTSRCFLPGHDFDRVSDEVSPRGHGTRVAGAILYPREVPKTGEFHPVAWIQNARVLNSDNSLPESLPPERYLTEVVSHFTSGDSPTKIFNHSISDAKPCDTRRMCSWAAKIDDLSHRKDLLFIQIAGNLSPLEIFHGLEDGRSHPDQLLDQAAKVASPGQSLHALTVGSIAHAVVEDGGRQSFARVLDFPSAFTRSGYSPLWNVVKPEVVEYGGDRLGESPITRAMPTSRRTAPELVASTLYGQPAISADDVGTSFAAPKVAHIAAQLQSIFPNASPQLYRALIVQSARWPAWAADGAAADDILRLVGYGIPSLELATTNNPRRVTMVTESAVEIGGKQYHLYQIEIPESIRGAAIEAKIRIDVTLAYTSTPRRTRSRRTGYLETWLDWRSGGRDEPVENFKKRMEGDRTARNYPGLRWTIHSDAQHGEVEASRDRGSVQKDWTVIDANQLPEKFGIAVRAHIGWNHKEGGGLARYCLAVSFEALDVELPVYAAIEGSIRTEARAETEEEVSLL